MKAAAPAPNARYPQNWFSPTRNAPDPPVVAMSARECPANDWPRITVNTPTTAEVTAVTPPTSSAICTGVLLKKPGSMTYLNRFPMAASPIPRVGHVGIDRGGEDMHRVRLGWEVVGNGRSVRSD